MSLPYNTIESFVQNKVMKVLVDNIFNHTIVLNRFLKKAREAKHLNKEIFFFILA